MTGRGEALAVTAALAAYVAVAVSAARTHSATFDETMYLPVGYAAAFAGDFRMNTVHPPLAKMIGALPLLALAVRFDDGDPAWLEPHAWKFGHRFLYEWNDAGRLLLAGRAAMSMVAVVMAAGLYLWCRRHWGRRAAAAALFLCLLSPEVLAHGALVTNDVAVACFFFLAVVAGEGVLERATPWRIVWAGMALGAALLSKHSALLLAVVLPLLAVVEVWRRDGAGERGRRLAAAMGGLAAVAAVAYVVLWAGYRFRFAAAARPQAEPLSWRAADTPSVVASVVQRAAYRHLLPEAYAHGLWDLTGRSQGRRAFLMGTTSAEGWWYYFPVAFVLKSPLPFLLLILAAPAALAGRAAPFVWVPVVVFALVALTTHVNIGVRYLLPLLPFLFVAAGVAAARLWDRGGRWRGAVAALAAWYAVGTLARHPHHLSFFNELAGGPYGGYRYLADSNVDWGQDLERLSQYVHDRHIPRIKLSYFGTASPDTYGIPYDLLPSVMRPFPEAFGLHIRPGDIVAVSATNLQGVYLPRAVRQLMDQLRSQAPLARVGTSLFVYRADFHWLIRPGMAEEVGWLPQATLSYRECLRDDPDHGDEAREFLAGAQGRLAAARSAEDAVNDKEDDAMLAPADGLR
jgi:dolichyl-phosphate-mannose-protein mannosyltransferase